MKRTVSTTRMTLRRTWQTRNLPSCMCSPWMRSWATGTTPAGCSRSFVWRTGADGGDERERKTHAGALGHHDVGGVSSEMRLLADMTDADAPMLEWEQRTHALLGLLASQGMMTVDELRRGIEALPPDIYRSWSYYGKWTASIARTLISKGLISEAELWTQLTADDPSPAQPTPDFPVGSFVRVREERARSLWPKPHMRTPGYVFGAIGQIASKVGEFPHPEHLAFGPKQPVKHCALYRVRFSQCVLWEQYEGSPQDEVVVDIFANWLLPSDQEEHKAQLVHTTNNTERFVQQGHQQQSHGHSHGQHAHGSHGHSHGGHDDHGHSHGQQRHGSRAEVEQQAVLAEQARRDPAGKELHGALYRLLRDKQIVQDTHMQRALDAVGKMGKQQQGVQLVLRAWHDPAFKQRLLKNANQAARELGIEASNHTSPTKLIVVESTASEHHLVCCTLCSCYPTNLLGPSPAWYKSASYRARAVRQPRQLLAEEFGTVLPAAVRLTVHDATADCRYMVLPHLPPAAADWPIEELASLVTRDCLIGVRRPSVDT